MKFFAPKNDWNMRSDQSWWGYVGGQNTPAGVRVNEDIAMTCSAWFCGLRIISETMAMLPCQLVRHSGNRVIEQAEDHPLYSMLLDQPNREQDSMCWFDMQTAFMPSWGNCYSEIQRNSVGRIVALWPIHPSRIPLQNVRRNGTDPSSWDEIEAGQPGELVYWVNNDDGSKTPIPASDMLHVPGVLSQNGITGQSIVKWGAQSLGIIIATERHAGAFFRNGATSNMAIKSPKIVGKDVADRLRHQWQQTFAGVDNHYKTLLLEDGMEPVPIDANPQNTQLIESRKFGPSEIARWLRLPPHMLGDLERATFANIEQQSLEFLIYGLSPWAERWVKALKRQLLTDEEKKSMFFQFDIKKILKADSAARAAYLQFKFNTGSASPNDIRAADGENPVEGGDTYFVQSNNYMPLDKVQDMAQAQIDKLNAPPPVPVAPKADVPPADAKPAPDNLSPKLDAILGAVSQTPTADELRDEVSRLIEDRDTSDSERLALREVESRKVASAARDCLLLSIEATVEGWMGYESRAAKRAAEKPQTFLTWRDEFYPEFQTKLSDALKPYAIAAQPIGFTFDASIAAADYVSKSVASLESIVDLPCDALAGNLNSVSESWAERPKRFAAELLKGGAV